MMKKAIFMLAILTCFWASCSDGGSEDPVNPTPKPEEVVTPEITISSDILTNGLTFNTTQGEKSVSFSTNVDWTLSIASTTGGSSWCKASATSGSKGSANVKFTVDEHTDYDDRSVSVTIKVGTASKTFTITQKCADALLITTNKYDVAQDGATIEMEVKANIDYQVVISETAKSWISEVQSKSRALTTRKHSFTIAASEETEKREGEITFKSSDKVETVKVYQAGGPIVLLTKNEYTVSDQGGTISVDLKSNVEFSVKMPEVDWITEENASRAMSSHTLKYIISPNEGYDNRSAEIIFYDKNSNATDTLKVIQAQKDAIIISQKTYDVKAEGETIEVKLSTNVEFDVTMPEEDWISQVSSRALTEHTLYFKIDENTGEDDRSVEIIFKDKASDLSDTIKINQKSLIKAGYVNGVVTIETAGTMKSLLGSDYLNIKSLKIVGPINGDDVYYLRKMLGGDNFSKADWGELTTLDLSEASIVEGGEWYYSSNYHTSNNTIGSYMFYRCTNLQNIILPNNVTSIGQKAFSNCQALKSVTIPDNVTSIGEQAFECCYSLISVTIPDNVISIDSYAFAGCNALTSVTIGNGVTSIGQKAFSNCQALKSVTIPDNVTSIGEYAFSHCDALTSVIIGSNVTSIGEGGFFYCRALTSVTIPDNVTSIGELAFHECDALTSIPISNGVTSISYGVFSDCDALTSVTIPDNVTSIGESAFSECDALTSVTIGNGVTVISNRVFLGCNSLTSVTIGNNVTWIGHQAFYNCI